MPFCISHSPFLEWYHRTWFSSQIMTEPPRSQSSSKQDLITFKLKISEKLDGKNFLVLHQQIELVMNEHNLGSFLILLLNSRSVHSRCNHWFCNREPKFPRLDAARSMAAFLASVYYLEFCYDSILGCAYASHPWTHIHDHFQNLTCAHDVNYAQRCVQRR